MSELRCFASGNNVRGVGVSASISASMIDTNNSNIKVLIAQNDETEHHSLTQLLSACPNIEVVGHAKDGQAAVFKALSLSPTVLVTDLELPFVDGIDATAQIRRSVPSCNVLVYTGRRQRQDVLKAIASGAVGYCLRGLEERQFELAVRSVALGAGWIDSRLVRELLHDPMSNNKQENGSTLSKREEQVLALLINGSTNAQIAEQLDLSVDSVKAHVRNLMDKLDSSDRTQLAAEAVKRGLV
jgi:DNA-binding NarL/FixJ family response regulator